MTPRPTRYRRGIALPVLLFVILLGGGLALGLGSAGTPIRADRSQQTSKTLAAARAALIGRAVNDDNRPGSLPCPDLVTDNAGLSNLPGDGKADLLTRNQCPSQLGRLPWITLATPRAVDMANEVLWYVVAPGLRDDDSAIPVNSDTPTGLSLNGEPEIAALLITAAAPRPGQSRPSQNAGDYLEGRLNGTAPYDYQTTTDPGETISAITRSQLFAAVEQRVAHSIRHCLGAHARQSGTFPWPAPLAASDRQGREGARFGRIPQTQPSAGIARRIVATAAAITTQADHLRAASPTEQAAALADLADGASWAANLLDQLGRISAETQALADSASGLLNKLQSLVEAAAANDRIARSEGESIRAGADSALLTVDRLAEAFLRYGLDFHQDGTGTRQSLLAAQTALQQQAEVFARLDTANPRPVQRDLVAPARAVGAASADCNRQTHEISQLAGELTTQTKERLLLAQGLQTTIGGRDGAIAALDEWQRKPSPENRLRADQAIAASLDGSNRLATGLDTLATLPGDEPGTAWPMVWASRHCAFISDETGWWQANRWAELIFYQASDPLDPSRKTLQIGGRPSQSLIVVSAGGKLAHQQRPGGRIADYLEAGNADPSRDGEARNPIARFDYPAGAGNDQLAY